MRRSMRASSSAFSIGPRPDYAPLGLEEKVLHGMSGLVVVEKKNLRLREIEGKLPRT